MTLLWGALALGAIYSMVAVGYNIVFISSGTFNFAHAQLMMLGTFLAYAGLVTFGWPAALSGLLAALVVGLVAWLEERIAVRPVLDHQTQLVTTLGVGTMLTGVSQVIWGGNPHSVPFFGGDQIVNLLGGRVYRVELALVITAVVLVVVLSLWMRRSNLGLLLLALSEDREAAVLCGVNVSRLISGAFVFSGVLAGALGLLIGPKTYAVASLAASLAVIGFVAMALGGIGSLGGSLIGGLAVGLVVTFSARYFGAEYSNLSVFLLLMAVLLVRPQGIFGRMPERTV